MSNSNIGITAVPGIKVGHYTDLTNATGCTVVVCEDGAVGGVDVRGSAPGTRETDLLDPTATVSEVHAVLLSGGSTFGLNAAAGVVQYLEEREIGVEFAGTIIPIVPAAILFDLGVVTNKVRPGPEEGYAACEDASDGPVSEGSVGAGTGATVAKLLGRENSIKGGIGSECIDLGDGLMVGAIVAVNAIGGVVDPETGDLIAGPRDEETGVMQDSMQLITSPGFGKETETAPANTTIGVVATNASLTKAQANKLASVAHDGLAMAVRPAHLMGDGDTMFALATGTLDDDELNMSRLCAATALCVSRAIVRGIRKAEGIGGVPAVSEL
ncbi:MAG: P1 family peptidase [Chloroflexi bacterium]|nr:P1 family peptidase [Chloroflexota bacterium]